MSSRTLRRQPNGKWAVADPKGAPGPKIGCNMGHAAPAGRWLANVHIPKSTICVTRGLNIEAAGVLSSAKELPWISALSHVRPPAKKYKHKQKHYNCVCDVYMRLL